MAKVSPIPAGYHTVTPYVIVKGASDAIEYYKTAFGATEKYRMSGPDGRVGHAELLIGNSHVMLADECPAMGAFAPKPEGGIPMSLCLYVEDVDTVFNRAVAAGATVKKAVMDMPYGDRSGTLVDPFGHVWTIATHIEDLTHEEINARMQAWMKKPSAALEPAAV
jgi:PhnB protein